MADARPFPGFRYHLNDPSELSKLIAPPYDVISREKRQELHDRSKTNCIRLILGDPSTCSKEELEDEDRYTKAKWHFMAWRKNGILRQDGDSMYIVEDEFAWNGTKKTRKGLICTIRLHEFKDRIVLPHESTLSGPIEDRRKLMLETRCQMSPVYLTCKDESGELLALLEASTPQDEHGFFSDRDEDLRHRMTPVSENRFHERINLLLKNQPLLIADGHHRYTTALNLKNELSQRFPQTNQIMVFLASASSDGFVLAPIHRHVLSDLGFDHLLGELERDFQLVEIDPDIRSFEDSKQPIALVSNDRKKAFALDSKSSPGSLPPLLFDSKILKEIFGIHLEKIEDQSKIKYLKPGSPSPKADEKGHTFWLRPLAFDEVLGHVEKGLVFPQKSTYFFPKIMSGFVFHSFE